MKSLNVVIVDYGLGNLYSVKRALEVCGAGKVLITDDPKQIQFATHVVLPGVGAFADGVRGLMDRGMDCALKEFVEADGKLLGICLGMQLLATSSEEFGLCNGLDLIPGRVIPIPINGVEGHPLKIPFVGWSNLYKPEGISWHNSILEPLKKRESVYLVHSFYYSPLNQENLLATYIYGGVQITAAIIKGNITGLQFHPEKSGPVGLRIVSKFLAGP
jgi:glutamine amidotransferase